MPTPTKKSIRPIVPRGKAIRRSDAEIQKMTSAAAMESLVEEAAEDWEENAPPEYSRLLGGKEKV